MIRKMMLAGLKVAGGGGGGQVAKVNFTFSGQAATSPGWVNMNFAGTTPVALALNNTAGTTTGWTLTATGSPPNGDGPYTGGQAPIALPNFPIDVLQTEVYTAGDPAVTLCTLSGLNAAKTYTFKFGLYDPFGSTLGNTTIAIGSESHDILPTGVEQDFTTSFSPTSGSIVITVSGSNGILNGLIITESA